MLTPQQKQYFDNMEPGTTVRIDQARNPSAFLEAAKFYIDNHNYSIVLSEDHSEIRKCSPMPECAKDKNFLTKIFQYCK